MKMIKRERRLLVTHIKMRAARHVKIITSQLENLEYLKNQLENLIDEIKNIISQGQSWIDEKETTETFTQMNQFLTSETSNCIQKCLNIANEDGDASHVGSKTEEVISGVEDIKLKLVEIDQCMTKHSTKLRDLKQKLKHQEKQNEIITNKWIETDKIREIQFEEIMKELHSASDFMSKLQTQAKMLSNENNEHEDKFDKLIQQHEDQENRINSLTKNHESNMDKLQAFEENIQTVINIFNGTVQPIKEEIETITSELVYIKTSNNKLTMTVQSLKKDSETLSLDLVSFKTSIGFDVYKQIFCVFQKLIEVQCSSPIDVFSKYITDLKYINSNCKRIAFSVGLTMITQTEEDSVIKYDKIIANIGDCYNVDTGKFMCPMDGIYLFHVSVRPDDNITSLMTLFKNSSSILNVYAPSETSSRHSSNMVIMHVKQNDEVFLESSIDTKLFESHDSTYNTFTGFLVHADM